MISAKRAEFDKIARECGISTVLSRLIRNRGIIGTEETLRFLSCDASLCHDPYLLPEMEDAAGLIREQLSKGSRFRIVGDYDVDGICSARILLLGLHALGGIADAILPERITDGYGINERLVDDAARDSVDIIITCDNGISAEEALKKAAAYGMKVVVTDHHEPPVTAGEDGVLTQVRVNADAVVDPKLEKDGEEPYPFRDICGAVVAFKLTQALFKDQPDPDPQVYDEMLSLCALATVCDVMPLADENRFFVKRGLELLSGTRNPGMRSLIMECGLTGEKLSTYHAGFIIGPCLNASGRMDSAARALSLLNETDPDRAMLTAKDLRDLNESRKSMTLRAVEEARDAAKEKMEKGRKILVLTLSDCHESLAGIVAGRIREEFDRPSIVLTPSSEEGILKGSGRSVEAYDMHEGLSRAEHLMIRFGGHKMAAGLTVAAARAAELEEALNSGCTLSAEDMEEVLHIDMELPPSLFTKDMVAEFDRMQPFGTGNPRPLFVTRNVQFSGISILGKNRNVIRFAAKDTLLGRADFVWFTDEGKARELIDRELGDGAFQSLTGRRTDESRLSPVSIVFNAELNTFRGVEEIRFTVRDLKGSPGNTKAPALADA